MAIDKPRRVIEIKGKPYCPGCRARLDDSGSVNWPHPTFAELEVREGKVHVVDAIGGDAQPKDIECSECGQRLDYKRLEF